MEEREIITKQPGEETRMMESWRLKQRIRQEQGYLRQPLSFFKDLYRSRTAHIAVDPQTEKMNGYAIIQSDGYLSLLAVDPPYQGDGIGTTLLDSACREHPSVTCHTRVRNTQAISFYESYGFEIANTLSDYYRDRESAHFLRYGSFDEE